MKRTLLILCLGLCVSAQAWGGVVFLSEELGQDMIADVDGTRVVKVVIPQSSIPAGRIAFVELRLRTTRSVGDIVEAWPAEPEDRMPWRSLERRHPMTIAGVSSDGWTKINLTDVVREWVARKRDNHGVVLKTRSEKIMDHLDPVGGSPVEVRIYTIP